MRIPSVGRPDLAHNYSIRWEPCCHASSPPNFGVEIEKYDSNIKSAGLNLALKSPSPDRHAAPSQNWFFMSPVTLLAAPLTRLRPLSITTGLRPPLPCLRLRVRYQPIALGNVDGNVGSMILSPIQQRCLVRLCEIAAFDCQARPEVQYCMYCKGDTCSVISFPHCNI